MQVYPNKFFFFKSTLIFKNFLYKKPSKLYFMFFLKQQIQIQDTYYKRYDQAQFQLQVIKYSEMFFVSYTQTRTLCKLAETIIILILMGPKITFE